MSNFDYLKKDHLYRAEARIDAKIKNLVNDGMRQDAIVFTRPELEGLETVIYETLFAPRDTLSNIPVSNMFAPGHTSVSYDMSTATGIAKTMTGGSTIRPSIDEFLETFSQNVYEGGASYQYDITDIERGQLINYDHVAAKVRNAVKAIGQWHEKVAFDGFDTGLTGFANNATVVAAEPTLADADWTTVTAEDMYTTVTQILNAVRLQSSGVHEPTHLAMSIALMNDLSTTRIDTTSGDTVLVALRRTYPGVNFFTITELADAGDGANEDRFVCYENDPANFEYMSTVIYDEAAPDKKGFTWSVDCRGRSGGTVVRRPLAMAIGDVQPSA